MTVPVVWISYKPGSPSRGYWDQGQLERLLHNQLWRTAPHFSFVHWDSFDQVADGAVVVIPGQHNVDYVDQLNEDLAQLSWVLLIIAGDEQSLFPVETLHHANMKLWIMTPRPGRKYPADARYIGEGPAPAAYDILPDASAPDTQRPYDWFFAGQVTHSRRQLCYDQLKAMKGGKLLATAGFAQGMNHRDYFTDMALSKVVPCPSGPGTPDSFRLFEALEAGCVPIADDLTPRADDQPGYWSTVLPGAPFPVLTNYDDLPGYTNDVLKAYPRTNNRVFAWWQGYKRQLAYNLFNDLVSLTGEAPKQTIDAQITVLVSSSPIASHPRTDIIEATIESIRAHLPDAEIWVMLDGVRSEQRKRRKDYESYKQRLLWLCNWRWDNVLPIIFDEHLHQAEMTRRTLEKVQTPLILFVEHDTPLTPDETIPWEGLTDSILMGDADLVRLHFEARIPAEHSHMMLDEIPTEVAGVPMVRTVQWSQRPHLASTTYYRRILDTYFSPNDRGMIEDLMHGVVYNDYVRSGEMGWYQHRLWIYAPEGNIKRSYHLDGRGGEQKYEMRYGKDD